MTASNKEFDLLLLKNLLDEVELLCTPKTRKHVPFITIDNFIYHFHTIKDGKKKELVYNNLLNYLNDLKDIEQMSDMQAMKLYYKYINPISGIYGRYGFALMPDSGLMFFCSLIFLIILFVIKSVTVSIIFLVLFVVYSIHVERKKRQKKVYGLFIY